jgi:hypothetical protein
MENVAASSEAKAGKSFFHLASFGRRMEFWIIGEMLRQGLDVYRPLVDDKGIDAIVRRPNGTYAEVQIKARTKDIAPEQAGLFAGIRCEPNPAYWFIFHSAHIGENGKIWLMTAAEFMEYASRQTQGKHAGAYTLHLSGVKSNKETGVKEAYPKPQFEKFACISFERLLAGREKSHDGA